MKGSGSFQAPPDLEEEDQAPEDREVGGSHHARRVCGLLGSLSCRSWWLLNLLVTWVGPLSGRKTGEN